MLLAPIPLPSFDNSAVDGYAVRHADIAASGETRLKLAGRVQAGVRAARPIGAGEAIRIFTGAPMPQGADTVYMQEDARAEGDAVIVPAGLKLGANRRLVGEDLQRNAVALPAGRRLSPADVALAAALGLRIAQSAPPSARRDFLDRRRNPGAGRQRRIPRACSTRTGIC